MKNHAAQLHSIHICHRLPCTNFSLSFLLRPFNRKSEAVEVTDTDRRQKRKMDRIHLAQTDTDRCRHSKTNTNRYRNKAKETHEQNLSSTDRYINMQTYKYRYRQKAEETDGDNFSCHDLPAWSSSPSCVLVAVIGIVAALVALVTSIVWVIRLSDHGS